MVVSTKATLKFNDDDIKDNTILSDEEKNELYRQIDLCDGFILQGGLYSSNYEIEMAKRIIELDKPLIGICAVFNNILRALGTELPHSGVSLVFTGIAVSILIGPDIEGAKLIQGTIAAAAVINKIIAVIFAKKGFEWAGELENQKVQI